MNKVKQTEEKKEHLLRLVTLGYEGKLYTEYKLSRIQLNILRWFNEHPAEDIAKRLKINRSYVYATVEKFKNIFTLKEINTHK